MTEEQSPTRPAILVVDDIEANLVAMAALLGELDCQIVRASSGNEALKAMLNHDFAVVLLDVEMPEMDGFEVARLARTSPRTRETPIIFVTALLPTDESILRGYASGAVDVLFKPVNATILLSKVQIFLDLHRQRLALMQALAAHERTLGELDAFNYSVSHDLRAPLRPVAGFSAILLEDYGDKLGEDGRALVERISSAASRMERIIDDLLRLSQISRAKVTPQVVDLAALARSVIDDIRSTDPERSVDFVAPAELPARADGRLLRLAFENLLRNAWKFTSKSLAGRIELGVQPGREPVYFFRDNGVGFDMAHAGKLFRPFQRLHAPKDFEGTGIGLAIVQRVIQHHGGRVWAESSPGDGATFSFTLGAPPADGDVAAQ